jgi:CBS domain-containing protein
MTERVVTVTPETTVRHAAELLADHGVTALPVVDGSGAVVGMVSEVDVITTRFPHDSRYRHLRPEVPPSTVGAVMTPAAFTVDPETDVGDLAERMWQHRHRCVPVVRGRRLVGIVTRRDLVRTIARDDTRIADDVANRLTSCGGRDRWIVRVHDGRVDIQDKADDVGGRRAAVALIENVPGVTDAYVSGGGTER